MKNYVVFHQHFMMARFVNPYKIIIQIVNKLKKMVLIIQNKLKYIINLCVLNVKKVLHKSNLLNKMKYTVIKMILIFKTVL